MLEIGNKAPAFNLKNQDGEKVALKDFKGSWLVLYFYPKDDTPGCTKEACDFTEGIQDFKKVDATVLGISPDDAKSHLEFIDKFNLDIPLLVDPEKKVMLAYDAWGLKMNYGKEYEGVIRSTFIINPDGKIAEMWRNVRVRSKRKSGEVKHAEIVMEKLLELKN